MKKTAISLILLTWVLILSACGKTGEVLPPETEQQKETSVSTETAPSTEAPTEELRAEEPVPEETERAPEEEKPAILEDNGALRITIPGRWEGKYIARKNSRELELVTNTDSDLPEALFFGFRMSLEDHSGPTPNYQRVGTMTNPEGTLYYLILSMGNDMGLNDPDTYYDLKTDLYEIITSVEAIEGWSLELDIDSSRADLYGDEFPETNGVFRVYLPYVWDAVYRVDSSQNHLDLYAQDSAGEYFLLGFQLSAQELDKPGLEKIAVMTKESGEVYGLYMRRGEKPEEANAYIYNGMMSAQFAVATSITAENGWSIDYIIQ